MVLYSGVHWPGSTVQWDTLAWFNCTVGYIGRSQQYSGVHWPNSPLKWYCTVGYIGLLQLYSGVHWPGSTVHWPDSTVQWGTLAGVNSTVGYIGLIHH